MTRKCLAWHCALRDEGGEGEDHLTGMQTCAMGLGPRRELLITTNSICISLPRSLTNGSVTFSLRSSHLVISGGVVRSGDGPHFIWKLPSCSHHCQPKRGMQRAMSTVCDPDKGRPCVAVERHADLGCSCVEGTSAQCSAHNSPCAVAIHHAPAIVDVAQARRFVFCATNAHDDKRVGL